MTQENIERRPQGISELGQQKLPEAELRTETSRLGTEAANTLRNCPEVRNALMEHWLGGAYASGTGEVTFQRASKAYRIWVKGYNRNQKISILMADKEEYFSASDWGNEKTETLRLHSPGGYEPNGYISVLTPECPEDEMWAWDREQRPEAYGDKVIPKETSSGTRYAIAKWEEVLAGLRSPVV